MTKTQIIWIISLNIASYFFAKGIEKITALSKYAYSFYQYFDINLYYAIFVAILNIGILFFILHRHKSSYVEEEMQKVQKTPDLIIFDNIDDGPIWTDYGSGKVYKSDEISWSGEYSLKKDANKDPYGGFRLIGKKIEPPLIFSGWIYRSDIADGRWADRLALEDENHNGYGFAVSHGNRVTFIERRNNGKGRPIGNGERTVPPLNKWYNFVMYFGLKGNMTLSIYDPTGVCLVKCESCDNESTIFDRIVIHGGYPYYVDDLRIMGI